MDTICAIATARATAAIGVIRVSGERAIEICDKIIKMKTSPLCDIPSAAMRMGTVSDGERTVDEVLCAVFKAPSSYTGEDIVEINCHGGIAILERVLRLLIKNGARQAEAGEFTKRAFLNGKLDLVQAEAVGDLIHSASALDASFALSRMSGKLSDVFDNIFETLVSINTDILAYVDFPEEGLYDVSAESVLESLYNVREKLEKLQKSFDIGSVIKDGADTVIVGAPNVGKSTLLNAIVGYDRSIVSDVAGTTRDMVSERATFGDIVLNLCDTAGIRDTEGEIEKIGINIAKQSLERADLVFAVFDSSRALTPDDIEIIGLCREKTVIAVINKSDKSVAIDDGVIKDAFENVVYISAKNSDGIDKIAAVVKKLFDVGQVSEQSGMLLTNLRHYERVVKALELTNSAVLTLENGFTPDLASVDITAAASEIALITGAGVSDRIIDDIFKKFCVGK